MGKQLRRVQNIMIALALVFANAVAAAGYAFNEQCRTCDYPRRFLADRHVQFRRAKRLEPAASPCDGARHSRQIL